MSRGGVQSLRQFVTECKDVFRLKLVADPPANVNPLVIKPCDGAEPVRMSARNHASPQLKFTPVIKLRDGAEPVRMSARKYASPQLKFMRDKIREFEELGFVYKNTGEE
jgi:hypothetical protein